MRIVEAQARRKGRKGIFSWMEMEIEKKMGRKWERGEGGVVWMD